MEDPPFHLLNRRMEDLFCLLLQQFTTAWTCHQLAKVMDICLLLVPFRSTEPGEG